MSDDNQYKKLMDYVEYRDWLYNLGGIQHKGNTYKRLFDILYTHVFIVKVPRDENRASDGRMLRYVFKDDFKKLKDTPATFLEVIISLARQCYVQILGKSMNHDETYIYTWMMLENAGLDKFTDEDWNENSSIEINKIINTIENRTYGPDGKGGLFPLTNPKKDQREVELWYQLNDYILDRGLI